MPGNASVVETHTAVLFFLGDRVYKLKKPVDLGFLDFSTPEARRQACLREVDLNRRLAPDVYLGVADVVGVDGEVCDHLVVMRRLPPERRLSACIERGEDVENALRQIARDLAGLHEATPPDPALVGVGSVARVRRNWDDNFDAMRPMTGRVFQTRTATRCETLVHAYLDGRARLFENRIELGRVRDGHGDLQAEDVFLLDDGPRVLDCLEFSDELRWGDVLDDAAFLAMDLERLGRGDLATRFLGWHREFSMDTWPDSLAHHYIAYRAHVRAKVNAIRVEQGDADAAPMATRLLELCLRHLEAARVRLVLVGGAPGTGKSALADALAAELPLVVVRTDDLRDGMPAHEPAGYGEGRYTTAARSSVYDRLFARARMLLELGESVVLDASWSAEGTRRRARALALATCSELVELRCDAPPEVADGRIRVRRSQGVDPSEATPEVAEEMRCRFDPWPEAIIIDTGTPLSTSVARALASVSD